MFIDSQNSSDNASQTNPSQVQVVNTQNLIPNKNKVGGIDFTDNIFNLRIAGGDAFQCADTAEGCFEFNIAPEEIKNLQDNVKGFDPVITEIKPFDLSSELR